MTREDTSLPFDVSRETFERLEHLLATLRKWNPKINLVSKSTLDDAWNRHIVDSAQVFTFGHPDARHWVDLGSGGGFPGLVIAILAAEKAPGLKLTMVESDQRKCAFLRTVLRETAVPGEVLSQRIEAVPPQNADILSARALADLPTLLGFAVRHLAEDGQALFPKGTGWKKEIEAARESWHFSLAAHTSLSDPDAVVLNIGALRHV